MHFASSSRKIGTGIALLWAAVSAQANTEESEALGEEEVVVSGTRTPKALIDSPVKIDVISGEQLKKVSQTTLGRALNFLPGVVAKRNQKDGFVVFLQGFSANRVLVLVDSQPLISPTGSEVDLDQISVADIERIEIMRGAGSVLYGSAAMGGVINIITNRNFANSLSLNTQVSSYVGNEIEGDEYGYQYRIQARGQFDKLFTRFSFQDITDPGFDYNPEEVAQDGVRMEKQFTRGEIGYAFKPFILSYRGQLLEEARERPVLSRSVPPTFELKTFYYLSNVEQQQHNFLLQQNSEAANNPAWKLNVRHALHEELSGNEPDLREAIITGTHLDSQKVWMGNKQELVGGVSFNIEELEQTKIAASPGDNITEVPLENAENYEAFLQYNRFGKGWDWLLGGRYQQDSRFNDHSALRVSGMKQFDSPVGEWRLRSSLGQSYRVPNLKELYFLFDHSNLGYMILGNELLQPETAVSGNVSLAWNLSSQDYRRALSLELNFHHSEAKNLIDTVLDPDRSGLESEGRDFPIDAFVYQNFNTTRIQGADLNLDYSLPKWQLQVNYSYLEAIDTESNRRLESRPRHQLKTNVSYAFSDKLSFIFYALHERDEQAPEGLTINKNETSTVNFNIDHQVSRRFRWQLGIDNIFDERRDTAETQGGVFDVRPVASRNVFLGFTMEFL